MFRRLGILTLTLLGAGCGGSGGSGGADLNCDGNPVDGAAPRAWYPDPDNDGFASVSSDVVLACADPGGGRTTVLGDCAPLDPLVSPAAVEVYDNDFDDDCNPLTLDDDHDADGVSGVDDCDDADPQVGSPGTSFVDVAASAGIAGAILAFGPDAANCADNVFVAGTAVGDIDGDGRWDVYVAGLDSPGYLYRNMGDGTFTDVTAGSGLVPMVGGSAAVFADLDADGDSDLYVTTISTGASRLYINDGAGHFVDEAVARGASARYGMDAILILDKNAEEELVTTDLARLLERLVPIADQLGCTDELAGIDEIVRGGASYQRQVEAGGAGTDLDAVAQLLVEEMRAGRPLFN